MMKVPPLTPDQVEKLRQQLGDAKPGDFVETDFFWGILPGPEDLDLVERYCQ